MLETTSFCALHPPGAVCFARWQRLSQKTRPPVTRAAWIAWIQGVHSFCIAPRRCMSGSGTSAPSHLFGQAGSVLRSSQSMRMLQGLSSCVKVCAKRTILYIQCAVVVSVLIVCRTLAVLIVAVVQIVWPHLLEVHPKWGPFCWVLWAVKPWLRVTGHVSIMCL